jgi:hypothetical protein
VRISGVIAAQILAAAVGGLLLVSCDQAPPSPSPSASALPSDVGLPPCGKPPSPAPQPPPPGAVLPPNSRITAVREQPPRVQLNGYVEATPAEVRRWIEANDDLEVVLAEGDAGQAELLVTDGTWRTFVAARAVCDDASLLAEVIAPQESDAVLPTPAP